MEAYENEIWGLVDCIEPDIEEAIIDLIYGEAEEVAKKFGVKEEQVRQAAINRFRFQPIGNPQGMDDDEYDLGEEGYINDMKGADNDDD